MKLALFIKTGLFILGCENAKYINRYKKYRQIHVKVA
jgi:hypothetical protein